MLEFIVLGRIPGTNVFINFSETLTMLAVMAMALHGYLKYRQYEKQLEATEHTAVLLAVVTAKKKRSKKSR